MGIYQNFVIPEGKAEQDSRCPRCGQAAVPDGIFFVTSVVVPLIFNLAFFKINFGVNVKLKYCPRCGFLRIEIYK